MVKLGTAWGNPLSEKRVSAEIEEAVAAKGWTKAEEAKADAVVILLGATEKKHDVNTFYSAPAAGATAAGAEWAWARPAPNKRIVGAWLVMAAGCSSWPEPPTTSSVFLFLGVLTCAPLLLWRSEFSAR